MDPATCCEPREWRCGSRLHEERTGYDETRIGFCGRDCDEDSRESLKPAPLTGVMMLREDIECPAGNLRSRIDTWCVDSLRCQGIGRSCNPA